MKYLIPFLIFYVILLSSVIGISIYAEETKMTASVPETEINKCVEVLKEAGYLK